MANSKTGFKSTKIGKIPIDWEVIPIKEFGTVVTGNTPPTSDSTNYDGNILFVSPADLGYHKYIYNTNKKLSEKGFSISRKMPKGSILFTCIGSTIGKIGIATENLTANQQINAILPDKNHDYEFLYYELSRNVERIKLMAGEQAVPIINKTDFEKIIIACPTLLEQTKIAKFLSTWDNVIETLEQLITRKECAKKALMQQLLTGKKGFKKYKKVCFTDVAELKHGYQFRDYDFTESGIPVIKIGNLTSGGDLKLDNLSYISDSKLDSFKQFLIERGDILMALSGATIGKVSYVDFPVDTMLQNYRVGSFKALNNKIDRMYLYYILQSNYVQSRVLALMNTGAQPNIGKADFDKIFFPLPEFHEQEQIASLLTSHDKEIKLLREQLLHYKNQKQGLMQQLLTGKIRVNI